MTTTNIQRDTRFSGNQPNDGSGYSVDLCTTGPFGAGLYVTTAFMGNGGVGVGSGNYGLLYLMRVHVTGSYVYGNGAGGTEGEILRNADLGPPSVFMGISNCVLSDTWVLTITGNNGGGASGDDGYNYAIANSRGNWNAMCDSVLTGYDSYGNPQYAQTNHITIQLPAPTAYGTDLNQDYCSNGDLWGTFADGLYGQYNAIKVHNSPDCRFIPVDYIVVAGGGGGGFGSGYEGGGGGGGGGFLTGNTNVGTSVITVGAGGGGGSGGGKGANGGNSSIVGTVNNIISSGGGGGGGYCSTNGSSGGSGGGGTGRTQDNPGSSGTPGQGNPGGVGLHFSLGGGGGGAGAAGHPQLVVTGYDIYGNPNSYGYEGSRDGGSGVTSFNGTTYSGGGGGGFGQGSPGGGGGGGSGGSGGGGAGAAGGGAAGGGGTNTGGGGGGGSNSGRSNGGDGGSGIVQIRYAGTTVRFTGGTITKSGGYVYHTFTDSGTLTYGTKTALSTPISMNSRVDGHSIGFALDYASSATIKLSNSDVRALGGDPGVGTTVKMSDFIGKQP